MSSGHSYQRRVVSTALLVINYHCLDKRISMIQTSSQRLQPMGREILEAELDRFINDSFPNEDEENVLALHSLDEINNQPLKENKNKEVSPIPDKVNSQIRKENKTNKVLPLPDDVKKQEQLLKQLITSIKEVHKCGSSTVQNILMRRGQENELTFVLPEFNNHLGKSETFDPDVHIGASVKLPDMKYDIFTHHTRYNATSVKRVMPQDTLTINSVFVRYSDNM
ncbi:hypothetical protein B566_EDAN012229 [Ephemera danica]|nr:hypothetical protein B566_EDAN012229 [Ephemera danica]